MTVQIHDDVRDHPELYSQIYTPHPVVVPGGRFRELYYWLVSLSLSHTCCFSMVSAFKTDVRCVVLISKRRCQIKGPYTY